MHREGTETLTSDNISKHQVTFLSLIFFIYYEEINILFICTFQKIKKPKFYFELE